MPQTHQSPDRLVDLAIERLGPDITIGTPLGLGKPVSLLNSFYDRARDNPDLDLTIITALSLAPPRPSNDLERRLMEPIFDRLFGDYPSLKYVRDLETDSVPGNVTIKEFYVRPGSQLTNSHVQRNHINTNYTYAVRDSIHNDVNVLAQMVTPARNLPDHAEPQHSLSCNADLTLDMLDALEAPPFDDREYLLFGQLNNNLPYMYGDCLLEPSRFDGLLDSEASHHQLFGTPSEPLGAVDYAIGLHASRLVPDGGTLQIGIGSLSEAIAKMLITRHEDSSVYERLIETFPYAQDTEELVAEIGGSDAFEKGLYASTEMFVRGFEELMRSGLLTREVFDHYQLQSYVNDRDGDTGIELSLLDRLVASGDVCSPLDEDSLRFLKRYGILRSDLKLDGDELSVPGEGTVPAELDREETRNALKRKGLGDQLKRGVVAHAGFFLGPTSLYDFLRDLDEPDRRRIKMERISFVNDLFGQQELKELQRTDARFINSGMKVTLSGAVVSDALEDMRVVSGVGGQYNFVAMAQDLPGARSVIMLPSTRTSGGEVESNIVWNYGHTTIPRHLRDIVVTEYGVADLRGRTDEDVIKEILSVTDARFQDELVEKAKASDKLAPDWYLPESYRRNTPETLEKLFSGCDEFGELPRFPFGSELTQTELDLAESLRALRKKWSNRSFAWRDIGAIGTFLFPPEAASEHLERMKLDQTETTKEQLQKRIVVLALKLSDKI